MAGINAGSMGIDVNAIVNSMMEMEQLRLGRLNKTRNQYDYQLNCYEDLNANIKNFSNALDSLNATFVNGSFDVSSSDTTVLTATLSGPNPPPSTHTVTVNQLASAHQVVSASFSGRDTALGISAALNLQTGNYNPISVNISATDTLEMIRDTINNTTSSSGISAAILSTVGDTGLPEFRLVLSANDTGFANQLIISGDAFTSLDLTTTLSPAQDAEFTFDGYYATSQSNNVTDLLDGLSFMLLSAKSTATISVTPDYAIQNQNIINSLDAVVNAYNAVISLLNKNQATAYTRDSTYPGVRLSLNNAMQSELQNPAISSLYNLGLATADAKTCYTSDGVEYVNAGMISLNSTQFMQALTENYDSVGSFFTVANTGFISQFQTVLTSITGSGGSIDNRGKMIEHQESRLDQKILNEEFRLDSVKEHLIKQWASVNTFVQRYQQLSGFLEQQLASLTINKK